MSIKKTFTQRDVNCSVRLGGDSQYANLPALMESDTHQSRQTGKGRFHMSIKINY